jgi:hypothetical protein
MSSKLISDPNWQHDFKDDLESSIYVLLWVMLMYSTCSNAAQVVPFMDGVLDPQAHLKGSGGFAKSDFLCGQSFLTSVKFPGRPKFDTLLSVLAFLFSSWYPRSPPSANEDDPMSSLQLQAYIEHESTRATAEKSLTHEMTIGAFDKALKDRAQWPAADHAVQQRLNLHSREVTTVASHWNTTGFLQQMGRSDAGGGPSEEPANVNMLKGR